jgi:hypothetical protein
VDLSFRGRERSETLSQAILVTLLFAISGEEWGSTMRRCLLNILTLAIIAGVLLSHKASADTSPVTAEASALTWLQLVDAGNYAQSWTTAASYLKGAVTQSQWTSDLAALRSSLGPVKSRQIVSAQFTRSLPRAPEGEYVVIRFVTNFEKKAGVTEIVTPMKDADGHWLVTGYYIK